MHFMLLLVVVLVVLAVGVQSAYCNGSPAPGERTNDAPVTPSNMKVSFRQLFRVSDISPQMSYIVRLVCLEET